MFRAALLFLALIVVAPATAVAHPGHPVVREHAGSTVRARPAAQALWLPVPQSIEISSADPAGLNRGLGDGVQRAYVQDDVIYTSMPLSPNRNRETYWHEVGHLVDATMLTDAMRRVIARDVFQQPVERWVGDGGYVREPDRNGDIPLREYFADAYAALILTPPGLWDDAYRDGFVGSYPMAHPIAVVRMERLRSILATLVARRSV